MHDTQAKQTLALQKKCLVSTPIRAVNCHEPCQNPAHRFKAHPEGFTARFAADTSDLIPEDSETGEPEQGYKFRGHKRDLRTLAFAMTDRSYSLESACIAFGVEHVKQSVAQHGIVTNAYIDYNRRDVQATAELARQ